MTSTWQEMKDAWDNGIPPILLIEDSVDATTDFIALSYNDVEVAYEASTPNFIFSASDPSDYPANGDCLGPIAP